MEKRFFVANWKSHKTEQEAQEFLEEFQSLLGQESVAEKEIIICPSFPTIPAVSQFVKDHELSVSIGAQNVSEFEIGAFTGEVAAVQIKEFARYVIIGHSERRRLLGETDAQIAKKVAQSLQAGLIPILCVQDGNTPVPEGVSLVAFEPVEAIGTGNPEDPRVVEHVFSEIKIKNPDVLCLYGGSITGEDAKNFNAIPNLTGFLIGGASLQPESFLEIIRNA